MPISSQFEGWDYRSIDMHENSAYGQCTI